MNKAEEFIKAKTRIGSNTTKGWRRNGVSIPSYSLPWLTPDQARKAVEIAREETIKEVCEWINNHYRDYMHNPTGNGGFRSVTLVGGFDSYISALLWKLITGHWNYRIESFELED